MNARTRHARLFWAVLIALSVALLPATLGAGRALASAEASMSTDMHDCCPDSDMSCDKAMKDCPFMAVCILKSFSFAAQDVTQLLQPVTSMAALAFMRTYRLPSHSGSPPLHPPQA